MECQARKTPHFAKATDKTPHCFQRASSNSVGSEHPDSRRSQTAPVSRQLHYSRLFFSYVGASALCGCTAITQGLPKNLDAKRYPPHRRSRSSRRCDGVLKHSQWVEAGC